MAIATLAAHRSLASRQGKVKAEAYISCDKISLLNSR